MNRKILVVAACLLLSAAVFTPAALADSNVDDSMDFGLELPVSYTSANEAPSCSVVVNSQSDLSVNFSLSASDSDGSIDSWALDVDDDGSDDYSGSGQPPSYQEHTYGSEGTYTARLTVTDNNASSVNDTASVTVSEASGETDISDSMSFGLELPVSYSSSGNEDDQEYNVSSSMDFGLELPVNYTETAVNQPPTVSDPYPADGSVDVSNQTALNVTVSDADNDTLLVTFYNASDDSVYGSTTQSDTVGGTTAGFNLAHDQVWADNSTYEWYVTVNDSHDHNITSSTWNFTTAAAGETANSPPVANFTYSADGRTVEFTDTSTDSDGSIASYAWEFGDGQTATAVNPTHVYTADGTYVVNLTVTDDDGATNTTSQSVTVSSGGGGTVTTDNETLMYVVIIAVVAVAMVAMVMISRRRR